MSWSPAVWVLIVVGLLVAGFVVQLTWLSAVLLWADGQTEGVKYYGRPAAARRRFKRILRRHARFLSPVLALLGRFGTFRFERVTFRHEGLAGPRGTCSAESFRRGLGYAPRAEDVFVVTQMRSGTTWMQQLLHEVLERGRGGIVERGGTLHEVSPWLEARKGVPVETAPLVGKSRPSRLIKTHMPAAACPWALQVRYVYVVRHPVSCFASCVDFLAANAGRLAPDVESVEAWFCSESMWWGPWPAHVRGWWERAREHENVLFVRYEDMREDLPFVVKQVTEFLQLPALRDAEREAVLHKCSFAYMRRHDEAFEMHPPHLMAADADLFVSGRADRHREVPSEVSRRITAWCSREMEHGPVRLTDLYPSIGVERDAAGTGR